MKLNTMGYKALVVGSALTLALVGCGSTEQASNKVTNQATQKSEEQTEQVDQTATNATKDADAAPASNAGSTNTPSDNASTSANANNQSESNSATASSEDQASSNGEADGLEAQFSKDQCTKNAIGAIGAGDMAANLTTSDLINGGGTLYYVVEFDLSDAHYRVMVDAVDGGIIDVIEYDKEGNVVDYSDQEGETVTEEEAEDSGMSANFSKDQCTKNAIGAIGAGDMAANLTTSDLINGGGTLYYVVEFDLSDAHYRVMVDAVDGGIIDVIETVDGVVQTYDE